MEAEKADVIISCFITLSGPLCNLPCKALTAGFSTSAKHLSKWIKYTEKYLWSFSGRARPGSRSRAEKLPAGHRPLHFIHFLRGVVNAEISWFFFSCFVLVGVLGIFFVLFFFASFSKRRGRGKRASLSQQRLVFLDTIFFSLFFFFSFTVFNPVLLTCLANTAMSSLKDSEEQTSPPATPGSLGVHVANSHFSKISAKRGNRGCLKENTIVTHTEGGKIS